MAAIVWGIGVGEQAWCEILFPKGDEDPDHRVVVVPLPAMNTSRDAWRAAHRLIQAASIEQLADWRSVARPIDRANV